MSNAEKFDKFLLENDFFEIAIKEAEEKRRKRREQEETQKQSAQTRAADDAPRELTDEDLAQAESRGYAAGLTDGRTQATETLEAQYAETLAPLLARLDKLSAAEQTHLNITQAAAFELLRTLLRKAFDEAHEKLSIDILQQNLSTALKTVVSDAPLTLRVHPDSLSALEKLAPQTPGLREKTGKITWKADHSLNRGDFIADWEAGGIDGRLNHILADMDKLLAAGAAHSLSEAATPAEDTLQAPAEPLREPLAEPVLEAAADTAKDMASAPAAEDTQAPQPVPETPQTEK